MRWKNYGSFEMNDENRFEFGRVLDSQLGKYFNQGKDRGVTLVCIGTDRVIGDSLAPFVGHLLKDADLQYINVIGNLEDTVNGINIPERIEEIKASSEGRVLIGLDASVGELECLGTARIIDGPLKPGRGMGKVELEKIGDVSILGIVAEYKGGENTLRELTHLRISDILRMATWIAERIKELDIRLRVYLADDDEREAV